MTPTLIQIFTFIAGFASGLTAMLLAIIWRDNRRFAREMAKGESLLRAYAGMAQGRHAPRNDEPTELDQ